MRKTVEKLKQVLSPGQRHMDANLELSPVSFNFPYWLP